MTADRRRYTGTVEVDRDDRVFGFIRIDRTGRRAFLHRLDCPGGRLPLDATRVEFSLHPRTGAVCRLASRDELPRVGRALGIA